MLHFKFAPARTPPKPFNRVGMITEKAANQWCNLEFTAWSSFADVFYVDSPDFGRVNAVDLYQTKLDNLVKFLKEEHITNMYAFVPSLGAFACGMEGEIINMFFAKLVSECREDDVEFVIYEIVPANRDMIEAWFRDNGGVKDGEGNWIFSASAQD